MYSLREIPTGIEDASELNALRESLLPMPPLLPSSSAKIAVLDNEARQRALQKRLERRDRDGRRTASIANNAFRRNVLRCK
jgi:hypothetical protein